MNTKVEDVDLVAAVEAGEIEAQAEPEPEVIEPTWSSEEAQEAEAMGWIPPERAKKLPEGKEYVGPVEYMERNPLYRQMKEMKESFSQLQNHYQKVSEIEHKKAEKEFEDKLDKLKAEKVEALDNADHSRVVEIDEEIRTTEKPKEEKSDNGDFRTWVGENKWYEDDSFLRTEADLIGGQLYSEDLVGVPLFDAVKKHLKQKYPDKFKNPAREKAAAVEGGTQQPVKRSKGASEKDLTADERTIYKNFKVMGVFKEEGSSQKYLEEVIALRD